MQHCVLVTKIELGLTYCTSTWNCIAFGYDFSYVNSDQMVILRLLRNVTNCGKSPFPSLENLAIKYIRIDVSNYKYFLKSWVLWFCLLKNHFNALYLEVHPYKTRCSVQNPIGFSEILLIKICTFLFFIIIICWFFKSGVVQVTLHFLFVKPCSWIKIWFCNV